MASSTTNRPEPPCLIENPYQTHQYHADRVTLVINRIDPSHFWLSFIPPRIGPIPDPYQTRIGIFFLAKNGYAGGTHAAVPRQYPYPRATRYGYGGVFAVPVLPVIEKITQMNYTATKEILKMVTYKNSKRKKVDQPCRFMTASSFTGFLFLTSSFI